MDHVYFGLHNKTCSVQPSRNHSTGALPPIPNGSFSTEAKAGGGWKWSFKTTSGTVDV